MKAKSASDNSIQVLKMMVRQANFCIDIKYIVKVLPLMELEIVPAGPHYVAGVMNLAGKSIPVIDLALRLSLDREEPYSLDTPIVLCAFNGVEAGLIIDQVLGLATVDQRTIQMGEEFAKPESLILGTLTMGTDVSLLIATDRVLTFNLTSSST